MDPTAAIVGRSIARYPSVFSASPAASVTSLRGRILPELLRHSAVYGAGQVLSRAASILLLPLYTHYLRPDAYGTIAILDLVGTVIAVVLASGLVSAAGRHHFEAESEAARDRVWHTSFTLVALGAIALVVPAWFVRGAIGDATLGPGIPDAAYYYALLLPTVGLSALENGLGTYARTLKWSRFFVTMSLCRLIVNIALNVMFLVVFDMGVAALLLGNLITGALATAFLGGVYLRSRGPYAFDRAVARTLWSFGWPLVLSGLLATLMHQADRYILRLFVDLHGVGVYSLAYQIGQGINTLLLLPFASIWMVLVFELAGSPHSERIYTTVFLYFTYGLSLILLAASLFSGPLLRVIAAPDYQDAADLVPVICLAYLFFSMHDHFKVPALIAKKTTATLRVMSTAAAVSVGSNLLLVPAFGTAGAAWAAVIAFSVFAIGGLFEYRRIAVYAYPFRAAAMAVGGMVCTYLMFRFTRDLWPSELWMMLAMAVAWLGWALGLFGRIGIEYLGSLRPGTRPHPAGE